MSTVLSAVLIVSGTLGTARPVRNVRNVRDVRGEPSMPSWTDLGLGSIIVAIISGGYGAIRAAIRSRGQKQIAAEEASLKSEIVHVETFVGLGKELIDDLLQRNKYLEGRIDGHDLKLETLIRTKGELEGRVSALTADNVRLGKLIEENVERLTKQSKQIDAQAIRIEELSGINDLLRIQNEALTKENANLRETNAEFEVAIRHYMQQIESLTSSRAYDSTAEANK